MKIEDKMDAHGLLRFAFACVCVELTLDFSVKLKSKLSLTAIIQRSEKYFAAVCPELDVVSQGKTVEEARRNIAEAVELFLETASPAEIKQRLHTETYISPMEIAVG